MSEVDAIEQVNTIWGRRRWTRAVHLLQEKGAPGHKNQVSARFSLTTPHPPAALQPADPLGSRTGAKGGGDKLLSQPSSSSSSSGIKRHFRASSALINANYMGPVINLGTQVLADENKTIGFFPVWAPAAIIKEPLLRMVWVRTAAGEAEIKMALLFGVCVGLLLPYSISKLHLHMFPYILVRLFWLIFISYVILQRWASDLLDYIYNS